MKLLTALVFGLLLLCYSVANGEDPATEIDNTLKTSPVSTDDKHVRSLEETSEEELSEEVFEGAEDDDMLEEEEEEEEDDEFDDEFDDELNEIDEEEDDEDDLEPGRDLRRKRKNKCARCMIKCERRCSKVNCFADCPTQCRNRCSSKKPICEQPIVPGPCKASIRSWGYDSKRGKCVKFIYGGCQGNDNRFSNKRECKQTCIRKCPKDKKRCRDGSFVSRDPSKNCAFKPCPPIGCPRDLKKCPDGSFVGRDPSKNCRFKPCPPILCTKDVKRCPDGSFVGRDPTKNCRFKPCPPIFCTSDVKRCPDGSFVSRDPAQNCRFKPCPPIVCTLDVKQCPDGSFVSRDPERNCRFPKCPERPCGKDTMTCSNGVTLFRRKPDCKFPDCRKRRSCKKPIEVGPCKAAFERWAYDNSQKRCVKFTYGGCGGNSNNFETQEECENACPHAQSCSIAIDALCPDGTKTGNSPKNNCEVEPCQQCFDEIDPGLCKAAFVRYAYNSKRKRCEQFLWGGCAANGNNFETMEACKQACRPSK